MGHQPVFSGSYTASDFLCSYFSSKTLGEEEHINTRIQKTLPASPTFRTHTDNTTAPQTPQTRPSNLRTHAKRSLLLRPIQRVLPPRPGTQLELRYPTRRDHLLRRHRREFKGNPPPPFRLLQNPNLTLRASVGFSRVFATC